MRATLNIDDDLLKRATKLSHIREKTALVRAGLEALITLESGKRLAALAGTEKNLKPIHDEEVRSIPHDSRRHFSIESQF